MRYRLPDHPIVERLEREGWPLDDRPAPNYDWLADYEIEEEPWEREEDAWLRESW